MLKSGCSVEGMGLARVDGRLVISGLKAPAPVPTGRELTFQSLTLGFFSNVQHVKKARWSGLHFSRCDLSDVGFFKCSVENCVFERCKLKSTGFWESQITNCSFDRCNMQHAAFGGIDIDRPKPNLYRDNSFSGCDMRWAAHSCEKYLRCEFRNCKLKTTDFHGAVFEDCRFEGKLDNLTFRASDDYRGVEKDRLLRTDFRDAELHHCQFLNIDIDPAWFPTEDTIVLPRGPADWFEWGKLVDDGTAKGRRWFIDHVGKDLGTPAIESRKSLLETFTPEQVSKLEEIAQRR